jgi:hypothetical protein
MNKKSQCSLANQIFTYDDFDGLEDAHDYVVYYDVKLIRDLGDIKAGTEFDMCNWVSSMSCIEFINDHDIVASFKLTIDAQPNE